MKERHGKAFLELNTHVDTLSIKFQPCLTPNSDDQLGNIVHLSRTKLTLSQGTLSSIEPIGARGIKEHMMNLNERADRLRTRSLATIQSEGLTNLSRCPVAEYLLRTRQLNTRSLRN